MNGLQGSYELTFDERPQYLHVRVKADTTTAGEVLDYLSKVAERCHSLGSRRLMLVRDIPETLSIANIYVAVIQFIHMTGNDLRIAFVDPHPANVEKMKLAMLISTNRRSNHMLFDNEASAEAWLFEGVDTDAIIADDDP